MSLKSQDVLVLLKLVARRDEPWTYNSLATELDLSPSQVHAAVQRAIKSDLAYETDDQVRVHVRNFEEFSGSRHALLFCPQERGKEQGNGHADERPSIRGSISEWRRTGSVARSVRRCPGRVASALIQIRTKCRPTRSGTLRALGHRRRVTRRTYKRKNVGD